MLKSVIVLLGYRGRCLHNMHLLQIGKSPPKGVGSWTGREKRKKKHVFLFPPLSSALTLTLTSTSRGNISTLLNLLIDRHGNHHSKNINNLLLHAPKYACATSYGEIASKYKIKGKKVWLVSLNDFVNHKRI